RRRDVRLRNLHSRNGRGAVGDGDVGGAAGTAGVQARQRIVDGDRGLAFGTAKANGHRRTPMGDPAALAASNAVTARIVSVQAPDGEWQPKSRRPALKTTPPPDPLPEAGRGSQHSSPPLRFGERVGGRGFRSVPDAAFSLSLLGTAIRLNTDNEQ